MTEAATMHAQTRVINLETSERQAMQHELRAVMLELRASPIRHCSHRPEPVTKTAILSCVGGTNRRQRIQLVRVVPPRTLRRTGVGRGREKLTLQSCNSPINAALAETRDSG